MRQHLNLGRVSLLAFATLVATHACSDGDVTLAVNTPTTDGPESGGTAGTARTGGTANQAGGPNSGGDAGEGGAGDGEAGEGGAGEEAMEFAADTAPCSDGGEGCELRFVWGDIDEVTMVTRFENGVPVEQPLLGESSGNQTASSFRVVEKSVFYGADLDSTGERLPYWSSLAGDDPSAPVLLTREGATGGFNGFVASPQGGVLAVRDTIETWVVALRDGEPQLPMTSLLDGGVSYWFFGTPTRTYLSNLTTIYDITDLESITSYDVTDVFPDSPCNLMYTATAVPGTNTIIYEGFAVHGIGPTCLISLADNEGEEQPWQVPQLSPVEPLLLVQNEASVELWRLSGLEVTRTAVVADAGQALSAAEATSWSRDGRWVYYTEAGVLKRAEVVDGLIETRQAISDPARSDRIGDYELSPDGNTLVYGGVAQDGARYEVYLVDVSTEVASDPIFVAEGGDVRIRFAENSSAVVVSTSDHVYFANLEHETTPTIIPIPRVAQTSGRDVLLSPDGRYLVFSNATMDDHRESYWLMQLGEDPANPIQIAEARYFEAVW